MLNLGDRISSGEGARTYCSVPHFVAYHIPQKTAKRGKRCNFSHLNSQEIIQSGNQEVENTSVLREHPLIQNDLAHLSCKTAEPPRYSWTRSYSANTAS